MQHPNVKCIQRKTNNKQSLKIQVMRPTFTTTPFERFSGVHSYWCWMNARRRRWHFTICKQQQTASAPISIVYFVISFYLCQSTELESNSHKNIRVKIIVLNRQIQFDGVRCERHILSCIMDSNIVLSYYRRRCWQIQFISLTSVGNIVTELLGTNFIVKRIEKVICSYICVEISVRTRTLSKCCFTTLKFSS